MSKKVQLVEIGPRDGFQNVKEYIPVEFKLEIIDGLVKAGMKKIQCTSFVSPKHIPQMKDAPEVVQTVMSRYQDVQFFALVPNLHGAKAAVEAGLKEISCLISLSVSHNQANIQRTHEQSLDEIKRIRDSFPEIKISQDISTVFGCPFDGRMEVAPLIDMMGRLYGIGIRSFTLCDTIGVAYPSQVREVLTKSMEAFPDCEMDLHIHDTRNMGIISSLEGVKCGAHSIQTSLGGLGGCPFAPGASGNTSTEDMAYLLRKEGYETGIDEKILLGTAKKLRANVDGSYSGHLINIEVNHADFV